MPKERITSLKEYALRWVRGQHQYNDVWALREVSLTVGMGEAVGVVGVNGAGKSTLLKVIARVLRPRSGRVRVCGIVAPVLGLGSGFDPELTGRENIYLNGAMLGFSRPAMNRKLEALLAFADIGDFIDAPLRTYSDGMIARLGFSIATVVQPDLLLIDEVLAVGDQAFQAKCLARLSEFSATGTTLLMVSHNPVSLQALCTRVIWLHHGRIRAMGEPAEVLAAYQAYSRIGMN